MKKISVLLVDDNAVVRGEFKRLLGLRGRSAGGRRSKKRHRQGVDMVKGLLPEVVLMDVSMPLMNGLQATREIRKVVPTSKVLMLSVHRDDAYVEEAINSGAVGYLVKETAVNVLGTAIREVHKGNTFFSPARSRRRHKLDSDD